MSVAPWLRVNQPSSFSLSSTEAESTPAMPEPCMLTAMP